MAKQINEQYNYARPESLSVRVATAVRRRMFAIFMEEFQPTESDLVLDIGVTADRSFSSSNYFEALYPHKHRIVAAGLDDATFLEEQYPGLKYQRANALDLPFADNSMDYVHSSAVWEHVGSRNNQQKMLAECLRVAKKGAFLSTPNRWFPIEFHTQLPLVHWLPKTVFRSLLRKTGYNELADERNLNLLSASDIRGLLAAHPDWSSRIKKTHLLGWPSNLLMVAHQQTICSLPPRPI